MLRVFLDYAHACYQVMLRGLVKMLLLRYLRQKIGVVVYSCDLFWDFSRMVMYSVMAFPAIY